MELPTPNRKKLLTFDRLAGLVSKMTFFGRSYLSGHLYRFCFRHYLHCISNFIEIGRGLANLAKKAVDLTSFRVRSTNRLLVTSPISMKFGTIADNY